ncbi:MAG: hypothetical protein HY831_00670 [Candidatus Aenigmarchaeota archaeon]|nr:hypothetical protein [Candidatus Aenigmarchaeota archaeon]
MNRSLSRWFLFGAAAATAVLGYTGLGTKTAVDIKPEKTHSQVDSSYRSSLPENVYVPRKFGHILTENEKKQLRKLHGVTWTWETGKWVSFPSGNYPYHESLVPDDLLKKDGYTGSKTYRGAGWKLEDVQDYLLVDFRDFGRNVTQETLNAGLMYPCAVALRKTSNEIGTLDKLDPDYPKITLIDAIERAYDSDTPRKCFRSSFQQLEAYKNTAGEDYDPDNHWKHAGYIARPGRGPHGTGNAFDVPKFLQDDSKLIELLKQQGFRRRLSESDPVHYEYVGDGFVDFPRPADVSRYARIYERLNEAKL